MFLELPGLLLSGINRICKFLAYFETKFNILVIKKNRGEIIVGLWGFVNLLRQELREHTFVTQIENFKFGEENLKFWRRKIENLQRKMGKILGDIKYWRLNSEDIRGY